MKMVSTEICQNSALDDIVERNLRNLTKSLTIMSAFTIRAETSSRFVCSVAKFTRAEIEKQTNFGDDMGKDQEICPFHHQLPILCQIRRQTKNYVNLGQIRPRDGQTS